MVTNIKFHFEKRIPGETLVTSYQLPNDERVEIDFGYRSLRYHPFVNSYRNSLSGLIPIDSCKILQVGLTQEDAKPYVEKIFTTVQPSGGLSTRNVAEIVTPVNPTNKESIIDSRKRRAKAAISEFSPHAGNNSIQLIELEESPSHLDRPKYSAQKFDGKPNKDAGLWLFSYEKFCFDNKFISDKEKISSLRANLADVALEWFDSMVRNCVDDWHFWKSLFLAQFCKNRISAAISADKWDYRYENQLMDYYYQKERFIKIAYPTIDENTFVTKVIMGLPEIIQNQMITLDFQSKVELITALKMIDNQNIPSENHLLCGGAKLTREMLTSNLNH